MLQQIIALIVIAYFLAKLGLQKKKKEIGSNEFLLWLLFWLAAALAVLLIRKIDAALAGLGFSASGIDILFYIAVLILIYFIFRLRLKIEKQERNISKIVKYLAVNGKIDRD